MPENFQKSVMAELETWLIIIIGLRFRHQNEQNYFDLRVIYYNNCLVVYFNITRSWNSKGWIDISYFEFWFLSSVLP